MKLYTKILSISLILAQVAPTSKIYAGKPETPDTCSSQADTANSSFYTPKQRFTFTPEQDRIISELVAQSDRPDWKYIATQVGNNATSKQCRERYQNYISPDISIKQWSPFEDYILIDAHEFYGNDWAKIATRLPGRSEVQIRDRYYGHLCNSSQFDSFLIAITHHIEKKKSRWK